MCIYAQVHVYGCLFVYIWLCVYVGVYMYVCMYMRVCMCGEGEGCVCECVYALIYNIDYFLHVGFFNISPFWCMSG